MKAPLFPFHVQTISFMDFLFSLCPMGSYPTYCFAAFFFSLNLCIVDIFPCQCVRAYHYVSFFFHTASQYFMYRAFIFLLF